MLKKLHARLSRAAAVLLALILALAPSAYALTTEQAYELLEYFYVDELPEGLENMTSVDEMTAALGDPYTSYMTAEEYESFLNSVNDSSVVGIGVTCQVTEEGLLIASVLDGSPAMEAGLAAGDLIVAADGQPLAGLGEAATTLIRGEAGTQVTLTVRRADGTQRELTLTRQMVVIANTTSELLPSGQGYILCESFGNETAQHFQDGLEAYDTQASNWVVDLRANPGGNADAAAASAAYYTGPGVLVYFRDGNGNYNYTFAPESYERLSDKPVLVLTSGYSASGAELFAGIVRDYKVGTLVGDRTFGKGVAQLLLTQDNFPDYFPDGDALKVTTYRFFAPSGTTNDKLGVIPHLLVSDKTAAALATLLSGAEPADSAGWLALIISGITWYIGLEQAQSAEYRAAFTELLEAVPPAAVLERGLGGGSWMPMSAADLAQQLELDWTSRSFPDAQGSEYADAINTLACYRLLAGDEQGLFHPEQNLTRGELASLLATLLRLSPKSDGYFSDVAQGDWYAEAVNALYEGGLIAGYEDGTFRPDAPVTREELIAIAMQMGARLNMDFYMVNQSGIVQDEPLAGVSDWAQTAVTIMDRAGIMWVPVEELEAQGAALREETAALIYNLLSYTQVLP